MGKRIVVALGGNALQNNGEADSESQKQMARQTMAHIASLIKAGHQIIVVHGNGPQVGNIVLHEEAINTEKTPTSPLDTCVAMSQGQIGYWLQQALGASLAELGIEVPVATVVTQVVVDENDAAFSNPTKPIGPFYSSEVEAKNVAREKGYIVKEDAGRGWRRVVPSPRPIDIVEAEFITRAVEAGLIVIAAGGGGVPVVHTPDGFVGREAVIDKDFAAAKIAELVNADMLLIITGVPSVTINFNTPEETPLNMVTVEEMESYIASGQFAPGSMLPKVQAAVSFVRTGKQAIITSSEKVAAALNDGEGTHIVK